MSRNCVKTANSDKLKDIGLENNITDSDYYATM